MINLLVVGFAFAFGGDGTYIASTKSCRTVEEKQKFGETIGAIALCKGKLTLLVVQNDEIIIALGF